MWLLIFFHLYSSLRNGLFETVHYLLKLNFASDVICYKSLSKYKEASFAIKKRSFLRFFLHKTFKKKYTSDYFWVTETLFSIFFSWFVLALIPVRWVCIRDVKCFGLFAFLHHPIGKFGSNSNSQKMDAWISVDGAFGSPRPNPMQKRGHGVIGCSCPCGLCQK